MILRLRVSLMSTYPSSCLGLLVTLLLKNSPFLIQSLLSSSASNSIGKRLFQEIDLRCTNVSNRVEKAFETDRIQSVTIGRRIELEVEFHRNSVYIRKNLFDHGHRGPVVEVFGEVVRDEVGRKRKDCSNNPPHLRSRPRTVEELNTLVTILQW